MFDKVRKFGLHVVKWHSSSKAQRGSHKTGIRMELQVLKQGWLVVDEVQTQAEGHCEEPQACQ
jgi:hypothetical protein